LEKGKPYRSIALTFNDHNGILVKLGPIVVCRHSNMFAVYLLISDESTTNLKIITQAERQAHGKDIV
jgi:hypothetical protein